MSSDVDWWARGVAGVGTALGILNLALAQSAGRWKRRHSAMSELEDSLRELATPVQNRNDPKIVQGLFTDASAGAALNELDGAWAKVPDRRFRRWLQAFVVALQAVPGGPQPAPGSTGEEPLNQSQKAKLREAESLLRKILLRIEKAARKGAS